MAADPRSRGNIINPSVPPVDTPYASDSSDLPLSILLANNPPLQPEQGPVNDKPRSPPPLSTRSPALSSSSPASSSPLRRKPLPATASPLATRFSTGEHLAAATLVLSEESFARPYSVDSPTLYEFPSRSSIPFSPAGFSSQRFSKYVDSSATKPKCFSMPC